MGDWKVFLSFVQCKNSMQKEKNIGQGKVVCVAQK